MSLPIRIPGKRHKYNAKAAIGIDGFRYASKAERDYGDTLVAARDAGEIRLLLRQVPFHMPGNGRLVMDFVYVDKLGVLKIEDVKGMETSEFKSKRRIVEQLYDIEIGIIKKGRRQ